MTRSTKLVFGSMLVYVALQLINISFGLIGLYVDPSYITLGWVLSIAGYLLFNKLICKS